MQSKADISEIIETFLKFKVDDVKLYFEKDLEYTSAPSLLGAMLGDPLYEADISGILGRLYAYGQSVLDVCDHLFNKQSLHGVYLSLLMTNMEPAQCSFALLCHCMVQMQPLRAHELASLCENIGGCSMDIVKRHLLLLNTSMDCVVPETLPRTFEVLLAAFVRTDVFESIRCTANVKRVMALQEKNRSSPMPLRSFKSALCKAIGITKWDDLNITTLFTALVKPHWMFKNASNIGQRNISVALTKLESFNVVSKCLEEISSLPGNGPHIPEMLFSKFHNWRPRSSRMKNAKSIVLMTVDAHLNHWLLHFGNFPADRPQFSRMANDKHPIQSMVSDKDNRKKVNFIPFSEQALGCDQGDLVLEYLPMDMCLKIQADIDRTLLLSCTLKMPVISDLTGKLRGMRFPAFLLKPHIVDPLGVYPSIKPEGSILLPYYVIMQMLDDRDKEQMLQQFFSI